MKHACCVNSTQSCLFDPLTAAHSCLKWIGASMLIYFCCVLWPAVPVSQLICLLWTRPQCSRRIFQLTDSDKEKKKWSKNHPKDREINVCPGWIKNINRPDIDLVVLRKGKVAISHLLGLYLLHFCQRGPLSVHQLLYNQFLPDPTWANFPLDSIYADTHLCLCIGSGAPRVYRRS